MCKQTFTSTISSPRRSWTYSLTSRSKSGRWKNCRRRRLTTRTRSASSSTSSLLCRTRVYQSTRSTKTTVSSSSRLIVSKRSWDSPTATRTMLPAVARPKTVKIRTRAARTTRTNWVFTRMTVTSTCSSIRTYLSGQNSRTSRTYRFRRSTSMTCLSTRRRMKKRTRKAMRRTATQRATTSWRRQKMRWTRETIRMTSNWWVQHLMIDSISILIQVRD